MGWLQSVEMQLACQSRGKHFALYQKAFSFYRQGKKLKNVYNWSSWWYVMSSCGMIFSSILLFEKKTNHAMHALEIWTIHLLAAANGCRWTRFWVNSISKAYQSFLNFKNQAMDVLAW